MITGFLGLAAPRLPSHGWPETTVRLASTGLLHIGVLTILLVGLRGGHAQPPRPMALTQAASPAELPRLVFLSPTKPSGGGGGGGGGNQQSRPPRHIQGIGHDGTTIPTAKQRPASAVVTNTEPPLPPLLLDARPLAAGSVNQIGLLVGGISEGTSTGSGSGGGAGTGTGSGIGSGVGPGVGPGSGGGIGEGVYRPGGSVTAPRLLVQVKPTYTPDALNARIQGTVWLALVVTWEGRPTDIRVVRSLDAGLDVEAMRAVGLWQFDPGRRAGVPVDVLVTVAMEFRIR